MFRSFRQLTALLLALSLLVDPVSAGAFSGLGRSAVPAKHPAVYQEQALVAAFSVARFLQPLGKAALVAMMVALAAGARAKQPPQVTAPVEQAAPADLHVLISNLTLEQQRRFSKLMPLVDAAMSPETRRRWQAAREVQILGVDREVPSSNPLSAVVVTADPYVIRIPHPLMDNDDLFLMALDQGVELLAAKPVPVPAPVAPPQEIQPLSREIQTVPENRNEELNGARTLALGLLATVFGLWALYRWGHKLRLIPPPVPAADSGKSDREKVFIEPGHPAYGHLRDLVFTNPKEFRSALRDLWWVGSPTAHKVIYWIVAVKTTEEESRFAGLGFVRAPEELEERALQLLERHRIDQLYALSIDDIRTIRIDTAARRIQIFFNKEAIRRDRFRGKPYKSISLAFNVPSLSGTLLTLTKWHSLTPTAKNIGLALLKKELSTQNNLQLVLPESAPLLMEISDLKGKERFLEAIQVPEADRAEWRAHIGPMTNPKVRPPESPYVDMQSVAPFFFLSGEMDVVWKIVVSAALLGVMIPWRDEEPQGIDLKNAPPGLMNELITLHGHHGAALIKEILFEEHGIITTQEKVQKFIENQLLAPETPAARIKHAVLSEAPPATPVPARAGSKWMDWHLRGRPLRPEEPVRVNGKLGTFKSIDDQGRMKVLVGTKLMTFTDEALIKVLKEDTGNFPLSTAEAAAAFIVWMVSPDLFTALLIVGGTLYALKRFVLRRQHLDIALAVYRAA